MRWLLGLVLVIPWLLAARCTIPPTPPGPVSDAGVGGTGGTVGDAAPDVPQDPIAVLCLTAEIQLEKLQCRTGTGSPLWVGPDGTPFAEQCIIDAARGIDRHPDCLSRISACSDVNRAASGALCADGGS